jgi:hypothetical protein
VIAFPKTAEKALVWPFCAEFLAGHEPEVAGHDPKWKKRTTGSPNSKKRFLAHKMGSGIHNRKSTCLSSEALALEPIDTCRKLVALWCKANLTG